MVKYLKVGLLFGILFASQVVSVNAQSRWSTFFNFQMNSGNYFFDSRLNSYYLYGGVRYQGKDWNLSVSLPVIASNGGSVSQFGNTFLPTQTDMHNNSGGTNENSHTQMMGTNRIFDLNFSIGDLYLYGNLILLNQIQSPVEFYLNGYVKFPLADRSLGFGTGKFDYNIAGGVKKSFDTFLFFTEIGYLILGDPIQFDYNNPLTYNVGIGKLFGNGKIGLLLTYYGYSKVLPNYSAPRHLSVGLNFLSDNSLGYSFIISKGFSELIPDYIISAGINLTL